MRSLWRWADWGLLTTLVSSTSDLPLWPLSLITLDFLFIPESSPNIELTQTVFFSSRWDRLADEPAPRCHRGCVRTSEVCETGPAEVWASPGTLLRHPEEEHRAVQQLCFPLRLSSRPLTRSLHLCTSLYRVTTPTSLCYCLSLFIVCVGIISEDLLWAVT